MLFFLNAFAAATNRPLVSTHPDIVGVTALVERLAARLMRRLGLHTARPYVAVQYRVGPDWRERDATMKQARGIACYGPLTIARILERHRLQALPRLVLTNVAGSGAQP